MQNTTGFSQLKTIGFFCLNILFGFLILFGSPFPAGTFDPWHSKWYFYLCFILIIGIGFFIPTRWWLWPIGLIVGQVFFIFTTKLIYPNTDLATDLILGTAITIIPLYILCGFGRGVRWVAERGRATIGHLH